TKTPECTLKTLKLGVPTAELRATVRTFAPGPRMLMFAASWGRALPRAMVPVTLEAKLMVWDGSVLLLACVIPSRSDPGPVSLVFWTTKLDGVSRSSRASTRSRTEFLRGRFGAGRYGRRTRRCHQERVMSIPRAREGKGCPARVGIRWVPTPGPRN